MLGIVLLTFFENDERTINSIDELHVIVPMGVVNESACARRCYSGDKRISRKDGRAWVIACSGPSGYAVVVTFDLYSMPVD
jgi:hypothetical protein